MSQADRDHHIADQAAEVILLFEAARPHEIRIVPVVVDGVASVAVRAERRSLIVEPAAADLAAAGLRGDPVWSSRLNTAFAGWLELAARQAERRRDLIAEAQARERLERGPALGEAVA